MKVIVTIAPTSADIEAGTTETFDNADGWHIDEERQLHVKKSGGGNLAAYGVHAWLSVREVAECHPEGTTAHDCMMAKRRGQS